VQGAQDGDVAGVVDVALGKVGTTSDIEAHSVLSALAPLK
jgi:hypothetical protein